MQIHSPLIAVPIKISQKTTLRLNFALSYKKWAVYRSKRILPQLIVWPEVWRNEGGLKRISSNNFSKFSNLRLKKKKKTLSLRTSSDSQQSKESHLKLRNREEIISLSIRDDLETAADRLPEARRNGWGLRRIDRGIKASRFDERSNDMPRSYARLTAASGNLVNYMRTSVARAFA